MKKIINAFLLLALAGHAWAGTSLTTQDFSKSLTFRGPGSTITVAGQDAGGFSIESSSGIKVGAGGQISLAAGASIRYFDGSISTTAAPGTGGGGGVVVFASTQSMNFVAAEPYQFTNTSTNGEVSISTLTITASGNYHICTAGNVNLDGSAAASVVAIVLEINGAFADSSFGLNKSPWARSIGTANRGEPIAVLWRSTNVQSAGVVSATLVPYATSGTGAIDNGSHLKSNWWFTECP